MKRIKQGDERGWIGAAGVEKMEGTLGLLGNTPTFQGGRARAFSLPVPGGREVFN